MTIRGFKPRIGPKAYRGKASGSLQASLAENVRISMQGIIENFSDLIENIDSQAGQIVLEALEPTFEKSQELVPVDKGDLKGSGFLEVEGSKGRSQIVMGYAKNGFPDYAVLVHEDLDARHEPPTQAKYLQQPLEEDALEIEARIIEGFKIASGLE